MMVVKMPKIQADLRYEKKLQTLSFDSNMKIHSGDTNASKIIMPISDTKQERLWLKISFLKMAWIQNHQKRKRQLGETSLEVTGMF
jgi:hypothetical protein